MYRERLPAPYEAAQVAVEALQAAGRQAVAAGRRCVVDPALFAAATKAFRALDALNRPMIASMHFTRPFVAQGLVPPRVHDTSGAKAFRVPRPGKTFTMQLDFDGVVPRCCPHVRVYFHDWALPGGWDGCTRIAVLYNNGHAPRRYAVPVSRPVPWLWRDVWEDLGRDFVALEPYLTVCFGCVPGLQLDGLQLDDVPYGVGLCPQPWRLHLELAQIAKGAVVCWPQSALACFRLRARAAAAEGWLTTAARPWSLPSWAVVAAGAWPALALPALPVAAALYAAGLHPDDVVAAMNTAGTVHAALAALALLLGAAVAPQRQDAVLAVWVQPPRDMHPCRLAWAV